MLLKQGFVKISYEYEAAKKWLWLSYIMQLKYNYTVYYHNYTVYYYHVISYGYLNYTVYYNVLSKWS